VFPKNKITGKFKIYMVQKPSLPKGTRDFGPEAVAKRNFIFDKIKACFQYHGYLPIETPVMESLSTLTGKYGEEGDRLLFKVLNNGDYLADVNQEDLSQKNSNKVISQISKRGLRYDLTVPFARFVAMNRNEINFPFKRFQIQQVWRADRPQKGRYQEFYQCDADIVGSDSLMYEAELIEIYNTVFTALNLPVEILVNNRKVLEGIAETIGAQNFFIENLSNNPKLFTPANLQFKYQQIYAGRSSAPCMFDYNKDGKMDLIVGEKNGNVNYFENIGTRENPQFDPNPATSPNSELWANINTRAPLYGSGFGQVNIFKYNNEPIIITANEAGKIQGYTLKDNIHTPVNLDHLGLPFVGEKLRLSAADINGDGILELALGNNRGGVSLFTSPFRFENPLSSKQISEPLCDIKLFPNPVTDILNIRATMNLMDARYSIFDINGKTLATGTIPDQNSSINLNPDWSQGIYFITFTSPKGSFAAKFVK